MYNYPNFGLYKWSETEPDKVALCDGRISLTYRSLAEKVDMLAAGMKAEGVIKGDKIFISIPNFAEFVIILFACLKLGAVLVCGNMQFMERELKYLAELMGQPKLAFMNRSVQSEILEATFPELKMITISRNDSELNAISGMFTSDAGEVKNEYDSENDMLIVFTSGSTGVPKGVGITVRNMLGPMCGMIERFHADENDVVFAPVPFCQSSGLAGILISILTGGRLVTVTRFDGESALDIIEKQRVTLQFCVTTMYAREIEAYNNAKTKPNLSSLRTGVIGGSPVIREYMEWFEKTAGCRLLNAYGMTECAGMIVGDYEDTPENRYGKIGRPCSNVKAAILDNDGRELPTGEQGEICCKSEGVTKGYYKNPEMTARLIDDKGWLHSGDIGVMDADGYVTLTGRKKEMIIRGGYNVFPAEVENAYCQHPDVLLAAVVPYQGGDLGEKIAVFLQMKDQTLLDAEQMKAYAVERLSKFKVPDRVIFISEMPSLPSGKIDKNKLSALLQQK